MGSHFKNTKGIAEVVLTVYKIWYIKIPEG